MGDRVFRLFGLWESGARVVETPARSRPGTPGAYAEALLAGWVPPMPEARTQDHAATLTTEEKADIADFLARFYLNQQC